MQSPSQADCNIQGEGNQEIFSPLAPGKALVKFHHWCEPRGMASPAKRRVESAPAQALGQGATRLAG